MIQVLVSQIGLIPLPVLEDLKGRPRFLGWEDGGDGAAAFWGDFFTGVANRFPFLEQLNKYMRINHGNMAAGPDDCHRGH